MSAWRVAFHRSVVRRVFVVWKTTALGFGWPNEAVKGTPQGNDDCSSTYWAAVLLPESPAVLNTCPPALDGAKIAFGFPSKKKKKNKATKNASGVRRDEVRSVRRRLVCTFVSMATNARLEPWQPRWLESPLVRPYCPRSFQQQVAAFSLELEHTKLRYFRLPISNSLSLFFSIFLSLFLFWLTILSSAQPPSPTSYLLAANFSRTVRLANVFDNLYLSLR